ncbi:MAG: tRNA (N6-threonylcarbamoyladenosine(37)-N6)-methyltransferase TrmO [Chloroflexota bacterium]|nr:tRNA (N6-threonylcarbamoyladenosine(37)-N6)-methyltransferase TrmO [Chloroflexota bacterium]MDE2960737.1 tRNA (N6-threonylcarbamoyladenosine(37)-N6)-methyltransferase TrmO [Chloroflexota bacterium]
MKTDPSVIRIAPVGYVRSQFTEYAPSDEMRERPSEIVVHPDFADGVMGLEAGDRILTLFVLHRAKARGYELRLHPGHNPANPIRGVFATRSQYRPNFIGATVALIQDVVIDEGTGEAIISVTELDAQDGSPVIDIKRHSAGFDGTTG